jgi:hypothetical protein
MTIGSYFLFQVHLTNINSQVNIFTKHLRDVGETYFRHGLQAMRYALTFLFLFVVVFIHAILPFLFVRTASNCAREMIEHMEQREI